MHLRETAKRHPRRSGETAQQHNARVFAAYEARQQLHLPAPATADRTFRNAWRLGQGIEINLVQARQLRRAQLAAEGERRLPRLRSLIEDAEDAGDSERAARLRDKRRQLRALAALDLSGYDEAGRRALRPAILDDPDLQSSGEDDAEPTPPPFADQ